MDIDADKVGEIVASEVSDAIETANDRAEHSEGIAAAILEGAMETERGQRVRNLEQEMDEWATSQTELAQAFTGMAMRLEELSGQVSTLLQSPPLPTSPEATSPSAPEDGPRENLEAETTVIVAPEAEVVAPPQEETPPPPRKRSFRSRLI